MVVSVTWGATGNGWTISNGGLDAAGTTGLGGNGPWSSARSNVGYVTGKWYLEIECLAISDGTHYACGLVDASSTGVGLDDYQVVQSGSTRGDGYNFCNPGGFFNANTGDGVGTINIGTRTGIAADCDHQELYLSNNGVWVGTSNPVTRVNPRYNWYGHPAMRVYAHFIMMTATARIHGDAASQTYAAPTGYLAWNVGQAAAQARVVVMA